jgi:hypothetical protein
MGKEVLHPGCNYYAMPDSVCNKCGKYIPEPTPPGAEAGKVEPMSGMERATLKARHSHWAADPGTSKGQREDSETILRLLATLDAKDSEIRTLQVFLDQARASADGHMATKNKMIAERDEWKARAEAGRVAYVNQIADDLTRLEAAARGLAEALEGLVNLKAHKDAHGKDDFYRNNQPLVWYDAAMALTTYHSALAGKENGGG